MQGLSDQQRFDLLRAVKDLYQAISTNKPTPYLDATAHDPAAPWNSEEEDGAPERIGSILNELLLHMEQAGELGSELDASARINENWRSLLNRFPIGLVVLDDQTEVVETNQLAASMLGDERVGNIVGGRLVFSDRAIHAAFVDALAASSAYEADRSTTESESASFVCPTPEGRVTVTVLGSVSPNRVALLMLPVGLQPNLDEQKLRGMFGLTQAEARVTLSILAGESVAGIARHNGVSPETVRTQLKAVFRKTDTSRQSELIIEVMSRMPLRQPEDLRSFDSPRAETPGALLETRMLTVESGRKISFVALGDPEGEPLVYLHSLRGCRLELPLDASTLTGLGLYLICVERPGHGMSDPHYDASFDCIASDLQRVLTHLNVDRFHLLAFSIGGYFALHMATDFADRISSLTLVSSPGTRAISLGNSMLKRQHAFYSRALKIAPQIVERLWYRVERKFAADSADHQQFFLRHSPDEPEIVRNNDIWVRYHQNRVEASRLSAWGVVHDLLRMMDVSEPDLSTFNFPVHLWHGEGDSQISVEQSRILAKAMPTATLSIVPGGHYMFYAKAETILAAILGGEEKVK